MTRLTMMKRFFRTSLRRSDRTRGGMTLVELLAAVLLLSIAAAGAAATWAQETRAVANERVTAMGAYCGVEALEQIKALRFLGQVATDTSASSPNYYYYNAIGNSVSSGGNYTVKWWITTLVNRDGIANAEDLRQVNVEVWNHALTVRYDSVQTMLAFGGV